MEGGVSDCLQALLPFWLHNTRLITPHPFSIEQPFYFHPPCTTTIPLYAGETATTPERCCCLPCALLRIPSLP
jgi:hypothetical protein